MRTSAQPLTLSSAFVVTTLILSGCGCPNQSQVTAIEHAGGAYLPGGGYHGACHPTWLWFKQPIDDDTFARLFPAIEAMSPATLQLTGQIEITDRTVDLINRVPGLRSLLPDGSGITGDGMQHLRPGIRIDHATGYH
jgi:hypothetical protein